LSIAGWLTCSGPILAAADNDDDEPRDGAQAASALALSADQLKGAGIVTGRPTAAKVPELIDATGLVLDPATLVADAGDVDSAHAIEQSTLSEEVRLKNLYGSGGGGSLKALESAKTDSVKAHALARSADVRFAQHWAPLETLSARKRQQLIDSVAKGHSLLLRVSLPGRHSVGILPDVASSVIDGVRIRDRVLGVLRQNDETQSVGILVVMDKPPAGVGAGARVPTAVGWNERVGLLVPRDAMLYDEHGAFVMKQLTVKPGEKVRYVSVHVTLLFAIEGRWLVQGVDDDDDIVIAGAGVLWSLAEMQGHVVDDDDDN
jgi:hypothetical protein